MEPNHECEYCADPDAFYVLPAEQISRNDASLWKGNATTGTVRAHRLKRPFRDVDFVLLCKDTDHGQQV